MEVNTIVRILSFDPASSNMGMAVMDYDLLTHKCKVVHTEEIRGPQLLTRYKKKLDFFKKIIPMFTKALCIQTAYYHYVKDELLAQWKPDHVVTEGAFQYKFVQTMVSLTLVINALRTACRDSGRGDINVIAPMETKKILTGKGNADKDQVRSGVLSNRNIDLSFVQLPDFLSEHEFDAIGHGYAFCEKYLPGIVGTKK